MTLEKNEFRLFRRPKPAKLEKLDLTKVHDPDDTDSISNTLNSNSSSNLSSTEKLFDSSSFLPNPINPISKQFINDSSNLTVNNTSKFLLPSLESASSYDDNMPMLNSCSSPVIYELILHQQRMLQNQNEPNYYSKNFDKNKFRPKMTTIKSEILDYNQKKPTVYVPEYLKGSLVKPFKHHGPDPLPKRPVKFHCDDIGLKKAYYDCLGYVENYESQEKRNVKFMLNDFILNENNKIKTIVDNDLKKAYVSNRNYKQICKILSEKISQIRGEQSKQFHVQTLIPDVEPVELRKPMRQSMIEMASYIKNELSEQTGTKLKSKLNPVSNWKKINGTTAELLIYEDPDSKNDVKLENEEDNEITISQLVIIDSLLRNGQILSLKAHFIDKLPDLDALKTTLIYINLSFNNFKEVPEELMEMHQLEAIKMRSNPIKYFPDKLSNLQNLKLLVFSYCQLSELPSCLFDLKNLAHLDVSYNRLNFINEKIVNLRNLAQLNLEGNELEYLPCCMLNMTQLQQINVKNNYLHPLIWRKRLINQIQSLFTLSAVCFDRTFGKESQQYEQFSAELRYKYENANLYGNCDYCGGSLFDEGLKIIRPCVKIFGVKFLPFLFCCCSPKCLTSIKFNS